MSIDSHIWAFKYEEIAEQLKRAKYKQEFHLYRRLARKLVIAIVLAIDLEKIDVISFVPTSKKHLNERGFDHSQYLAKLIAKKLKFEVKPILEQAFEFVQVSNSNEYRHKVPRYICNENVKDLRILLIDDVATTRTSLNRSAEALKKCGAKSVDAATLAYQARKTQNVENILRNKRIMRTENTIDTCVKNMI